MSRCGGRFLVSLNSYLILSIRSTAVSSRGFTAALAASCLRAAAEAEMTELDYESQLIDLAKKHGALIPKHSKRKKL